jgi:thiamine-monophosphate kinase
MISGEFSLIRKIQRLLGKPSREVLVGIGDDAAVIRSPGERLLVTTDSQVETIHFRREFSKAQDIGHKALAVNLSDVAAMGGTPRYAVVSLGLNRGLNDKFVLDVYRGMKKLAERHGVEIVGGNVARVPTHFFVDITLLGCAPKRYLTRQGTKPGDCVAVTGDLGASAAGLAALKAGKSSPLISRHTRPNPRVREGRLLCESGKIHSLIDVSDGLASELHHLAERSGVGFRIFGENVPISAQTQRLARALGKKPLDWALFGGEDYELLFTFSPKQAKALAAWARKHRISYTVIGQATRRGLELDGRSLSHRGWDHFG